MDLITNICVLFVLNIPLAFSNTATGDYVLKIHNMTSCPKTPDSVTIHTWLESRNTSAGWLYEISVEYNLTSPIGPVGSQLILELWNKEKKRFQYSMGLSTNKICDWFFFRPLVTDLPKANKRCYFVKGHCKFSFIDINTLTHKIFGTLGVYGKYNVTFILKSRHQVFLCRHFFSYIQPI